jgi:Ran-binding protein 1
MSTEEQEPQNPTVEGGDDDDRVPEEEVTVVEGWAPSVTLEVKDHITTGEEEEETLYSQRSKLLRWAKNDEEDGPAGEWKERGTGDVKLLKNKSSGHVRLLMRQEKTMKIVANHYVVGKAGAFYSLKPNAGSDKIWVWLAQDYAEGEMAVEQFALKFGTPEKAKAFYDAFEEAKKLNEAVDSKTEEKAEETKDPESPKKSEE